MSLVEKAKEYCNQCGYEIQKDGGVYFYNTYVSEFGFLYFSLKNDFVVFYPQLKKVTGTLFGKEVTLVGSEPLGNIKCIDYDSFKIIFDKVIKQFKEIEQEIKLDEIKKDFE